MYAEIKAPPYETEVVQYAETPRPVTTVLATAVLQP